MLADLIKHVLFPQKKMKIVKQDNESGLVHQNETFFYFRYVPDPFIVLHNILSFVAFK